MGISLKKFASEYYHTVDKEIYRGTFHGHPDDKQVSDYAADGFVYGLVGVTMGSLIGAPAFVLACKTDESVFKKHDPESKTARRKLVLSVVVGAPGIMLGFIAAGVGAGIGACVGIAAKGVKAIKHKMG